MPLVATRGAASAQGFGEFARVTPPIYIEDVFSTYLYTGNGSTQTITNGIDYTKGFLYWAKTRDSGAGGNNHYLVDSERGANSILISNTTGAALAPGNQWTALTTTSITVQDFLNLNGRSEVGWTFRKQAKFFDVVTYTGNGVAGRTVSHNLGSTPGCMIVKNTSNGTVNWAVYHRSVGNTGALYLNTTNATDTWSAYWNNTTPTSANFTLGNSTETNANGATYVAYLFAHDAGGFGAAGTDNVISCGSVTLNGSSAATVTLGYEPQWLMLKCSSTTDDWYMLDTMRGFQYGNDQFLAANTANASNSNYDIATPTATGFSIPGVVLQANQTYIYIAIRRGPMKTPTSGTSVFSPNATTATTGTVITPNFPVDAQIIQYRTPAGGNILWQDRLRGVNTTTTENNNPVLTSNDTSAESSTFASTRAWSNTGFQIASALTGQNRIYWSFGRAPSFFDEVCYTGNGNNSNNVSHNLGGIPELIIVKSRSGAYSWSVNTINNGSYVSRLLLNSTVSASDPSVYDNGYIISATSTTFLPRGVSTYDNVNRTSATYVAYLFASCPGVSKVGSYTGTGALQTINCGFASGARFVLIKRTDSTGDWWVYDSARGISSGNDPYLFLNSTAAEVTNTNYVDTASTGFQVTAAAPAGLNANGGTYIFLAIS